MPDIKDTKVLQGLNSAVMDILQQNQNLYQQDLERQYGHYGDKPQMSQDEVEAVADNNVVDVPEPVAEPEDINPDDVIAGASGVEDAGQEEAEG